MSLIPDRFERVRGTRFELIRLDECEFEVSELKGYGRKGWRGVWNDPGNLSEELHVGYGSSKDTDSVRARHEDFDAIKA